MKKFFSKQSTFIIIAIIIGFLLNRTDCEPDPYCEPDPLYGGCSSSCNYGTTIQWATKGFGIWIVLNVGSFIGMENLKKKEYLQEFLNRENLKYTVREIDKEWEVEEKKSKEDTQRLMETIKARSKE